MTTDKKSRLLGMWAAFPDSTYGQLLEITNGLFVMSIYRDEPADDYAAVERDWFEEDFNPVLCTFTARQLSEVRWGLAKDEVRAMVGTECSVPASANLPIQKDSSEPPKNVVTLTSSEIEEATRFAERLHKHTY